MTSRTMIQHDDTIQYMMIQYMMIQHDDALQYMMIQYMMIQQVSRLLRLSLVHQGCLTGTQTMDPALDA